MKPKKEDPFSEVERLSREVDRWFLQMYGMVRIPRPRSAPFQPPADVFYSEQANKLVVRLDIAGVDLHEARIELQGRTLLVEGIRRESEQLPRRVYQQMELECGPFQRRLALPVDATMEGSSVSYENGILRIELPLLAKHKTVVPVEGKED